MSGGSCTQCGVGSCYKSAIGDGGCTTASSGYYTVDSSNNALSSPYKGAVGVKQADKGYHVVDSSGTATNSGGVRQDECPVGRYADADGTTECIQCEAGSYGGSAGLSECAKCVVGTVTTSSGQSVCSSCSAGYIASSTGLSECTACESGYYATGESNSACVQASAGSYASNNAGIEVSSAATKQTECSTGRYSADGAYSCSYCAAGTIGSETGLTVCTPCSSGKYAEGSGNSACTTVSAGYIATHGGSATNSGASAQSICLMGTYSGAGATECLDAASGYYTVDADNKATSARGAVGQRQVSAGFVPKDINGSVVNTKATSQSACGVRLLCCRCGFDRVHKSTIWLFCYGCCRRSYNYGRCELCSS